MPANCSADVSKVIEHVDSILLGDDEEAKQAIKEKFGLGAIEHDDDFASALENGPWQWQGHDFASGYSSFCKQPLSYLDLCFESSGRIWHWGCIFEPVLTANSTQSNSATALRTSAPCTRTQQLFLARRVLAWRRPWRDTPIGSSRSSSPAVSHCHVQKLCINLLLTA